MIKIQRARRRRGGGFLYNFTSLHPRTTSSRCIFSTSRTFDPPEGTSPRANYRHSCRVCVPRNVHIYCFFSLLYSIIFSYSRRKCSRPAVAVAATVAVVDAADRGCTSAMSYRRPEATHDDRIGAKATDLHAGDW